MEWKCDKGSKEEKEKFHNQPERSKREDSSKDEMRCSEHCGNTMREVQ